MSKGKVNGHHDEDPVALTTAAIVRLAAPMEKLTASIIGFGCEIERANASIRELVWLFKDLNGLTGKVSRRGAKKAARPDARPASQARLDSVYEILSFVEKSPFEYLYFKVENMMGKAAGSRRALRQLLARYEPFESWFIIDEAGFYVFQAEPTSEVSP